MPFGNLVIAKSLLLAVVMSAGATAQADEEQMTRYGCWSCHRVNEKLIGPAFRDVAAKYRNRTDTGEYLFQKIREGGEGVWGDIPMIANTVEKIPDEELQTLIAWIRNL